MEKINTVSLEESTSLLNEEENKIMKLSETYWKDYLEEKNYNKDINKMCELCIEGQIKKHGKQTIVCSGLNSAEKTAGSTVYENVSKSLTAQELKELDAIYNPFTYMSLFMDYNNPNRVFEERFYQKMILGCSARYKVVRMGRRTGKSQSIAMLAVHRAIMNPDYRILLVSPFAVQTEEVINTIKKICSSLPENPLVSSKQTPAHKLTFSNGSILMGFTSSTDGNQIRGQPADLIILDETDDIPEKAITSIMGIKMQNPEVEVWRSGTPKGEKNLHRAEQDIMAKSFHYPSYVLPQYSDAMDATLRAEMGEGIGYVEEVLAEISSGNNQIFQTMFLSRACNKPQFITAKDVLSDRQRFIVFLGVDWNHDKVGTRLIVMAYDKSAPQVYIIDKEIVAVEGFTQHAAQDKIISLNRKYSCDHIFADQGFGATQIANLKQFAMSQVNTVPRGHPDLKLVDLHPIDYGSVTEVQDPVSGAIYRTPTKQLAVQNCVEMLEKDLIALHTEEDRDIILQFKNYVEKSRNKGRITYGYLSKKIGDHDLDAIIIGLFGIKKLYSSLFISESTQALIKYAGRSEDDTTEVSSEELDNAQSFFGLSFGSKNKNNKSTSRGSSFSDKSSRVGNFKTRGRTVF